MPNITPINTPERPAKRQNTASVNYSTPVRNNLTATAGFSTPVAQQQATQLKSLPKLKEQDKEYLALESVISSTMAVPRLGNSPARGNLQPRNDTSNRVPDTQNP